MLSKEQEIECAKDVVAFQHYFYKVIEERRKEPKDDMITDLVQAQVVSWMKFKFSCFILYPLTPPCGKSPCAA
jgi:hypothetical protein